MIAIVNHTEESLEKYRSIWNGLIKKLKDRGYIDENKTYPSIHKCSDDISIKSGYSNKTYKGTLKEELSDLSSLEVAMICDGGYSWFGGTCSKDGLKFNVKIYTD